MMRAIVSRLLPLASHLLPCPLKTFSAPWVKDPFLSLILRPLCYRLHARSSLSAAAKNLPQISSVWPS